MSVGTVQGHEWLPDFYEQWQAYEALQDCSSQGAECLEDWSRETGETFTHVFVPRMTARSPQFPDCCSSLVDALEESSDYEQVYDQAGATVFVRKN